MFPYGLLICIINRTAAKIFTAAPSYISDLTKYNLYKHDAHILRFDQPYLSSSSFLRTPRKNAPILEKASVDASCSSASLYFSYSS